MEDLTYEHEALSSAEAMLRLLNNADFNKIFVKDFLEESLVTLGYNFASNVNMRTQIAEQIVARKHLRDFIDSIVTEGSLCKDRIEMVQSEYEQGDTND